MNYAKIRKNPDSMPYMLKIAYRKLNCKYAVKQLLINYLKSKINEQNTKQFYCNN